MAQETTIKDFIPLGTRVHPDVVHRLRVVGEKLGLYNRTEVVRFALEKGLRNLEESTT